MMKSLVIIIIFVEKGCVLVFNSQKIEIKILVPTSARPIFYPVD